MSIPLNNLYHWIDSLLQETVVLYVFQPHGSKKISDCNWLKEYNALQPDPKKSEYHWLTKYNFYHDLPAIIMHDQEPLDWNLYAKEPLDRNFHNRPASEIDLNQYTADQLEFEIIKHRYLANFNLKFPILTQTSLLYDRSILVHSEKNSDDLLLYNNIGFICIHYWAHAIIARDWYRFAEIDSRLQLSEIVPQNKFLIYCRDWSSHREYRLKFLELLVKNQLDKDSKISVMHSNDEGTHFSQFKFTNPKFNLISPELLYNIPHNQHASSASADYDYFDFVNSHISVVLETVFDGNKIHLTEKTLRPIACGHPFILAAGPGSLEYIKSCGFKTFAPWIDESYDQETDSLKRLEKIIKSMKQIQNLQGQELENFSQELKKITVFNKNHFFSNEFFSQVSNELKNNLDFACSQVKQTRGTHYLELLKLLKIRGLVHHVPLRREKIQMLKQLRQSYPRGPSNPAAVPPF